MARKVCAAGVMGSFSFIVLDEGSNAVSLIRDEYNEIVTHHLNIDQASEWTERKLRELIGKMYEADGI
ncbi:MAG: hypothetical protein KGI25_02990 [Thaumarchaeota archaeon]|nr:hypothetical protein [Nitrososphaerota archaeon]